MEKKQRKNILFIHETLRGAGAERVFVDLVNRFDFERFNVTLLLLYGGGVYVASLSDKVELITLFQGRSFIHKVRNHWLYTRLPMLRKAALKAMGGREFDAIISFLEGPAMRVHSMLRHLAPRNISWVHVNLLANHWSGYMFRDVKEEAALYSQMDELVFVSEGAREAFIELFGPSGVRKHVIPNVIDRDRIVKCSKELKVERRRFTIVNVGRFQEQKNHRRLLDVAAELKRRHLDFDVRLVGSGPLEGELRRKVKVLGLQDNIIFEGFQTNPYAYMAAADMFLLTSDTEGWPTVVCEALSLGLPVVSTRVTGAEELLAGDAGVLVGTEVGGIADAVMCLAENPQLLADYSRRARERAQAFNPDEVLKRICSLLP